MGIHFWIKNIIVVRQSLSTLMMLTRPLPPRFRVWLWTLRVSHVRFGLGWAARLDYISFYSCRVFLKVAQRRLQDQGHAAAGRRGRRHHARERHQGARARPEARRSGGQVGCGRAVGWDFCRKGFFFIFLNGATAEALRDGASRFETTARKLKRNMWWKNARVRALARRLCLSLTLTMGLHGSLCSSWSL